MMRLWTWGCAAAIGLVGLGCDDGAEPMVDAGPEREPVGIGAPGARMPASLACRGSATAPMGGADTEVELTAVEFITDEPVGDLAVHFFADNSVPLTPGCEGSCQMLTTDAAGMATATAPLGGWYAYRIPAGQGTHRGVPDDFIEVIQYNEVTTEQPAQVNAVSTNSVNTLTATLLIEQQAGNAILTGRAFDCDDAYIANAQVRVFGDSGEIMLGRDRAGPKAFYFNGTETPAARATQTAQDGLWGVANVPVPADDTVRVETWGVVEAGGAPEMLGCEEVQVVADGITVINVGPTRADGPTTCSG